MFGKCPSGDVPYGYPRGARQVGPELDGRPCASSLASTTSRSASTSSCRTTSPGIRRSLCARRSRFCSAGGVATSRRRFAASAPRGPLQEATWTGKRQLRQGLQRGLSSPDIRRRPQSHRGSISLSHPRGDESIKPTAPRPHAQATESSPRPDSESRQGLPHQAPRPGRDACPILLCTRSAS